MHLEHVRQIVRPPPLTIVPGAPEFILGIISIRGAVVALFGIAVESSLLVGLAALLLLGGILARFLPGTRSPSGGDDPEQEETYVEEESEES